MAQHLFHALTPMPDDPIMGINQMFQTDPREGKVNLSIGVFLNEAGKIPLLEVVEEAEKRLAERRLAHGYLPIEGLAVYRDLVQGLVFGESSPARLDGRITTVQTLGGTGALRIAARFAHDFLGFKRAVVPDPTWGNHIAILKAAGFEVSAYPYYDRAAGDAVPEALVASLEALEEPTLILMHACAHNPTGCDLTCEVWERVGDILEGKGHLALLDMAYQGFARGIDEDAEAIRMLAARGLNFLASSSSSKNFGLYGERVGALHAVCASKQEAETVLTILKSIVRCEYSCPAEHGARIVAEVLGDPELSQQWRQAVDKMRRRVEAMRAELSAALKREGAEIPALDRQKGMFSFTGLTADEMKTLREEFAVYGVSNGRICIAGLNLRNVGPAAHAIAEVLKRRG